jgi:hypothetical protein
VCIGAYIGRQEEQFSFELRAEGTTRVSDWYSMLWNALADVSEERFRENALSIITFNYDRSLELFLSHTYANTYDCTAEDAWRRLSKVIRFQHVYGDLGAIDNPEAMELNNGVQLCARYLNSAKSSIRVIGERAQEGTREACLSLMNNSERICFLGFGFAASNCDVIGVAPLPPAGAQRLICGTAVGTELGERMAVCSRLGISPRIELGPLGGYEILCMTDCAGALRHFGVLL